MYKLLIVDDEYLVRRGIKSLVDFKKLNISEVYEASNGIEALEIFKEKSPDIVLADINMPKMNGLIFAQKIKNINPNVMIAVITGYDYFDYAVSALKIGIDDYILKPASKSDIEELLSKFIHKLKNLKEQKELNKFITKITGSAEQSDEIGYKEKINSVIENNFKNHEFSLVFLANEIGFSTGYMSGLFKKTFGVTFQEYILNKRLETAKLLILSTDMKNYEIAEEVGFDDVNYFGTRFKSHYGVSPKQYKDRVRSSDEEN